jgi:hypothetical protein
MCFVCETDIEFKPGDSVLISELGRSSDENDENIWVSNHVLREVLEVTDNKALKVKIGESDTKTFEYIWPSDVIARLRGEQFLTMETMFKKFGGERFLDQ